MTDRVISQASIIGAMLIDEKIIGHVMAEMDPQDFLDKVYRNIFQTIRFLFSEGKHVDLVTVCDALRVNSSPDLAETLKQCMEIVPSVTEYREYIKICKERAQVARLKDLGMALASIQTGEAARDITAKINAELVPNQRSRGVSMKQLVEIFYERLKKPKEYLPWGLYDLDRSIYAEPGSFILIAARPSAGKTAFALMAAYAQAEKYRVGMYSLETGYGQIAERTFARVARVDMERIKAGSPTEDDYEAFAVAAAQMEKHSLDTTDAAGWTVDDIFADAQSKRRQVIYIDYVQIIAGDEKASAYEKQSKISSALHTKARATGITVVGLAQLNRCTSTPKISDIRDSGQYEQDADVIMMLYRTNPDDLLDPGRQLDIAKNKEGRVGHLDLMFDGATQRFRCVSTLDPPPERKRTEKVEEKPADQQMQFYELPNDGEPLPF